MAQQETLEQWESRLAAKRGQTVEQFRAWYGSMDMKPIACDGGANCGHSACTGWRLEAKEFLEEDDEQSYL